MASFEFKDQSIPQGLTDCVKESVFSIFATILGSSPAHRDSSNGRMQGEGLVGIISFVGDITWLLMLELPEQSARSMATKFCGFDIDYDSPDMADVVGELANVLAGDIVGRLSNEGVKVALSLPTIMRGQNVEPLLPRGVAQSQMNFSSNEGDFSLKLAGSQGDKIAGHRPGT